MNLCPAFEELNALVDGDLISEREVSVRCHVDMCRACTREVNRLIALKAAVGRAHDSGTPSPALRRAVVSRSPKQHRWRWWLSWAAVHLWLDGLRRRGRASMRPFDLGQDWPRAARPTAATVCRIVAAAER